MDLTLNKASRSDSADALVVAIILNYKNYDDTICCVEELLKQDYSRLLCVIVDNASPNDSIQQLKNTLGTDRRVTILEAPFNGGYAAGNNVGARWASINLQPTYILIINPDVRMPEPSSITRLVAFADLQRDAGAVSPKVILPNGFVQGPYERPDMILSCIQFLIPAVWLVRRNRHQREFRAETKPRRCFRTIGACMLLRADSFAQVGMFDEGTFLENEEPILAELFNKQGKYFYHYPDVTVVHHHTRPGDGKYTMTSLKYYFKTYRGASDFALSTLEFCSKFYDAVYAPLKRRLPITQ